MASEDVTPGEVDPARQPYEIQRTTTEDSCEATELGKVTRQNPALSNAPVEQRTSTTRPLPRSGIARALYEIAKFWRAQVAIVVDHEACRDHLALERTFLGYLRTSLAISMIGVIVAQLFRLQHAPNPDSFLGYYVLGRPLAGLCQGLAIYTLLLGAFRTWRIQNAMVRGKALTGGWDLICLWLGVFTMVALFLALFIAVDVRQA